MQEVLDLKKVVEDIISSYEKRIESISSTFDTTNFLLGDFQEAILNIKEERESVNAQLRDALAKNEHLRKKDFDRMMQEVIITQDKEEKEARSLVKNYLNEQKEMAKALRENLGKFKESLAKGEAKRVKEFQVLIKDIITQQDKRKDDVTFKLKKFQEKQRVLAKTFKNLLAKGRQLRIRDLKEMLKDFESQRQSRLISQRERREEAVKRREDVTKMLGTFRKVRRESRPASSAMRIDTRNKEKGV